jgi:hypothetical protein
MSESTPNPTKKVKKTNPAENSAAPTTEATTNKEATNPTEKTPPKPKGPSLIDKVKTIKENPTPFPTSKQKLLLDTPPEKILPISLDSLEAVLRPSVIQLTPEGVRMEFKNKKLNDVVKKTLGKDTLEFTPLEFLEQAGFFHALFQSELENEEKKTAVLKLEELCCICIAWTHLQANAGGIVTDRGNPEIVAYKRKLLLATNSESSKLPESILTQVKKETQTEPTLPLTVNEAALHAVNIADKVLKTQKKLVKQNLSKLRQQTIEFVFTNLKWKLAGEEPIKILIVDTHLDTLFVTNGTHIIQIELPKLEIPKPQTPERVKSTPQETEATIPFEGLSFQVNQEKNWKQNWHILAAAAMLMITTIIIVNFIQEQKKETIVVEKQKTTETVVTEKPTPPVVTPTASPTEHKVEPAKPEAKPEEGVAIVQVKPQVPVANYNNITAPSTPKVINNQVLPAPNQNNNLIEFEDNTPTQAPKPIEWKPNLQTSTNP